MRTDHVALRRQSVLLFVFGRPALAQNASLVLAANADAQARGGRLRATWCGSAILSRTPATPPTSRSSVRPTWDRPACVLASRVIDAIRPHGLLAPRHARSLGSRWCRGQAAPSAQKTSRRASPARSPNNTVSGDAKNLLFSFDRELRDHHIEATALAELQIARLTYDPRSGRFDVSLELPGSAAARRLALRFIGTVVETVPVAVLMRPVGRGEVVKPSDVVDRAASQMRKSAPTWSAPCPTSWDLPAAAHSASARLLRTRDLMKPEIVQRNEQVTLVYEAPGMLLTIRGKALEVRRRRRRDQRPQYAVQAYRPGRRQRSQPGDGHAESPTARRASFRPPSDQQASSQASKRHVDLYHPRCVPSRCRASRPGLPDAPLSTGSSWWANRRR